MKKITSGLKLDVAVIGGGVAGTYSAWRLQKSGGKKKLAIGLFEYSDRIGGRLYSRTLPGMPNVVAELGGMRYIPSTQPLVTGLIDKLKLPSKDFPMGNPNKEIGASLNYYYLRGKHLKLYELSEKGKIPYNVSWQEEGMNPDQLQAWVMKLYAAKMCAPINPNPTLEQWFNLKVFGKYMYEIGYWNFLSQVLTNEAYSYMSDAGGYDANVANASTIAQLPISDFGPTTEFRTLVKGYQSLPITLAEEFEKDGGQVYMNQRLKSIVKQKDGSYLLTFAATDTKDYTTTDANNNKEVTVHAKKVILAMPRRSLELIEWNQFKDNEFLRNNIGSVLIQSAFKLFMGYDYAWWRSLNLWYGRSITDLPIRQTYYFDVEGEQPNTGDPKNTKALLMASYNDISTVPYWKGLETGDEYAGNATSLKEGIDPNPPAEYKATQNMVDEAHRQVMQMHGLEKMDKPFAAIFHDWSGDPYGGGWHEWKAGYRYDEVIQKMIKPVGTEEVFIIGEAYSNNQGWVEGSLETAADMMERFFKLKFLP